MRKLDSLFSNGQESGYDIGHQLDMENGNNEIDSKPEVEDIPLINIEESQVTLEE